MKPGFINIALKSLFYYRKSVFQQFIIIALLASVITGSLLTGYSVRESLRNSIGEKLGKTGFIISSGLRYFDPDLSEKFGKESGLNNTPLLNTDGFAQDFASGLRTCKTKIYGINRDFFSFHGIKAETPGQGEVVLNSNLASKLGIKAGDDIIITLTPPDDIPAGSPFASSAAKGTSVVVKVIRIAAANEGGNFATGISQITPDNLFMNINDPIFRGKANMLLIESRKEITEKITGNLQKILSPEDIGLKARKVTRTGEYEIISSRIFIDQKITDNLRSVIHGAYPVITYLANSISYLDRSTPYSFIAAIGNNDVPEGNKLIINKWLAKDLDVRQNDSVTVTWYAPVRKGDLAEKSEKFKVAGIAAAKGVWADSLLMPEFPGIAGSKSCTSWDAGVDIKMDRIRKKDEAYWDRYRGTPKAFISYNTGKKIWGNNFGPATAIRFSSPMSIAQVDSLISGRIYPLSAGFTIRDIYNEMIKAADNGVDFGTLFIGLGFFVIISCIVILILAITSWFDSREKQVSAYRSLGLRDKLVKKLLFAETGLIAFAGAAAGGIVAILFNRILIGSLNSVWQGAVQTNSLSAYSGIGPIVTGFCVTFFLSLTILYFKLTGFLKKHIKETDSLRSSASKLLNKYVAAAMTLISVVLLIINFTSHSKAVYISFISGSILFVTLIIIWRIIVSGELNSSRNRISRRRILSGSFYSFHPDKAIMPVLLIAAGLFAIVITGINRQRINAQSLSNEGGTGGYALWAETSVPIREELNSRSGRKIHGLEDLSAKEATFIMGKRVTGDDASCLNLNFIAAPPLLGIDPTDFRRNKAFSFASLSAVVPVKDPWSIINEKPAGKTIYGLADQTVLEWGLKKRAGDTLRFSSESGEQINVIIAGGLKPSIFQGYLLISEENLNRFWPSVGGYTVILAREKGKKADTIPSILSDRFENYGITISKASDRLASFFTVTNTYLSVFTILGFFGMLLGVAGLGFVLIRNYTSRRREFALMISSGYRTADIRRVILEEQFMTLIAGIFTGVFSGLVSSSSSVNNLAEIPWLSLLIITGSIAAAGSISLLVSIGGIEKESLVSELRKE